MEDLYISEHGDNEELQETKDLYQNESPMSSEVTEPHKHPNQNSGGDSLLCQHRERQFTSRQGLEQHMHIHACGNEVPCSIVSSISQIQHEQIKPVKSVGSVIQLYTSDSNSSNTSILSSGEHTAQPHEPGVSWDHDAQKYPEQILTTNTNKQHHEHKVDENQQQLIQKEKKLPEEEILQSSVNKLSLLQTQFGKNTSPTGGVENEGEHTEQYMLDISSNISENLSFYIDGKIVSTSTVSNCEVAEVHSESSTLVGLDALIVDPAHISHILSTDTDVPGQQHTKRRTATPPLLPQIKTELESEVVVSSSSSSLVSSLIENLFPHNTESTVAQNERTVFLSPKLKQLLEKQDGLKPTLALITDSQKPSSPVSVSILPSGSGRFKRRTGSPTSSPQQFASLNDETNMDGGDFSDGSPEHIESQHSSPVRQTVNDNNDATPSVMEPAVKSVLPESWPPVTGGNACNQQPLDLSNTVKRNEDVASTDAVLDLSLQKNYTGESEPAWNLVSQAVLKEESSTYMVEKGLMKVGEQNITLGNPETPVVTDFAIVTGSDIVTPAEPVAEGLVYGLTLPPGSLTPSPNSITPVSLDPASPCTIAFASPVAHTVLPTTPSLITVLASPPSISHPSSQPIQVLAPNISPEPLVICTENTLSSSECDLPFASTSSANIVALSQPLDPPLNLPGHVFLTDQIALNPPLVESTPVSEVPFTPTVTLNDSLLNSYNIASNTVLIECTIALEAPGGGVPAAVTLQENTAEPPAPTHMVVNHIEQQQIVSLPNPQTVDPSVLVSSIAGSVTLSTDTAVTSDFSPVGDPSPDPESVRTDPPPTKEGPADSSGFLSEIAPKTPPPSFEKTKEEEASSNSAADEQQQTFTKNFICNVCDKLFHSMKELSHHVGDHADEWPYKCEFCVLLFGKPSSLLDHRSSLHGVGKTYVCGACTKEFVYLCNLKQHQEELHPGQQCTYTEEENGKLRPQNYNNSTKVSTDPSAPESLEEPKKLVKKEESEVDVAAEELFTTIKIMASDGRKIKGPDVRLGINQHYPSFKPPPFPYHNRSPAGLGASATNFTTHNIPQTFSTAIRCTKCGKSFDNMPELHKHILACANASDKRRYTPRKNPIPLRHFAKTQNRVLSTTNSTNGLNASVRFSQADGSKPGQDPPVKLKILNKRKKKFAQRVMPQRNKSVPSNKVSPAQVDGKQEIFICPHCCREFTMRRSRTKHMAVCPKKPKEMKKRKDGGISVAKENDGHLHRGVTHTKERQQATPQHKTRLQTSGSSKRPAILPVQTVFSSKRSKIIIKESTQPKQEAPTLTEIPIRTFNPSMRQYSRVQHSLKGVPIKITVVKPQQSLPQKDAAPALQSCEKANGTSTCRSEQSASV
ncbi:PR domain zinc finger protein 2 [Melanotaenia boesemani]|uniref:PR domain zinc finger protein 2 n=1 Tax=Melanotaenia boesemani TaxID=1250792 RepID=UPI001C055AD3|nr:PR domain zinc finger protein 2 [Melanotaenia boesemani]XP_041859830.1 PR domain zinc finger protein 2 [Melanotaenia boesemani]XP_041859831.1 PR domain zinc finger protein 2 [Melanotaenia boesemani]XP_041859832.1 PR domain zinc finger protein 2 [Melanotaenia boesemani]XP_041859833.1 PR domain zinc finger protein 2 [Melanotaenia boesemani]